MANAGIIPFPTALVSSQKAYLPTQAYDHESSTSHRGLTSPELERMTAEMSQTIPEEPPKHSRQGRGSQWIPPRPKEGGHRGTRRQRNVSLDHRHKGKQKTVDVGEMNQHGKEESRVLASSSQPHVLRAVTLPTPPVSRETSIDNGEPPSTPENSQLPPEPPLSGSTKNQRMRNERPEALTLTSFPPPHFSSDRSSWSPVEAVTCIWCSIKRPFSRSKSNGTGRHMPSVSPGQSKSFTPTKPVTPSTPITVSGDGLSRY